MKSQEEEPFDEGREGSRRDLKDHPDDHVMDDHERGLMELDREEILLRIAISKMQEYGLDVSPEMEERLRDIQAQKGFDQYLHNISDPTELIAAIERSRTEGFPDQVLEKLTPPQDFFIQGNNTKQ